MYFFLLETHIIALSVEHNSVGAMNGNVKVAYGTRNGAITGYFSDNLLFEFPKHMYVMTLDSI